MKRGFLLLVILIVTVLTAVACSSAQTTPPAVSTTTTTAPAASTAPGAPPPTTSVAPTTVKPTVTSTPTTTTPLAGQPRRGGTLRIVLTGPVAAIGTLGAPTEYISGMYGRVSAPAMEYLFAYDANERYMPQLAESWEISPDGKQLTIHLRKGVKFQDGTPLNAQALKADFDIMKVATNVATWKSIFKNVASYDVLDDYTLRVNFSAFDYNFMVNMSLYSIMSPTAIKLPTTPENMAKDHMVGTGPFKFVGYSRGEYIKYVRFDGYWQPGKPYLDSLEINQIDDPVTSVIYFRTGSAQLIFGITPKDALTLEPLGYKILKASANSHYPIVPDGGNKDSPFADIKVRQALEYALDKKAIASIGQGFWEPAYQMAIGSDARYVSGLAPRNYDPAKAKQLLTEAGYPTGFKTTLIANSTYDRNVLVAIQAYLKAVGIDAALDLAEAGRFTDLQAKGWKGLLLSGTPVVGDIQSLWNRFGSQTLPSMYRGNFQQKLEAAIGEPDYDKRLALLKELVKTMYDDASVIPMYASPSLSAADKTLQGEINWTIGHPNMWYPANAWLSQ